jgi:hypothetical protein
MIKVNSLPLVEWIGHIITLLPDFPSENSPFSPSNNEKEKMITGFYGIDHHKRYFTIAVLNCKG